ncbi:MAG: MBL fold metallo-hydrolase [Candidatus Nezhaarchaeota archaeon]|nr:MBL fold metallo-hydrolase [Candidatus Nezhaarchaeota archaeon]
MCLEVGVARGGAIIIGRSLVCDGFEPSLGRRLAVFTHAHEDHLKGLEEALAECQEVYVTPETRDLLVAIRGPQVLGRANLKAVEPSAGLPIGEERLTLYPSGHMLGSVQVAVEARGRMVAYTSEFLPERARPLRAEVLIVDATYGSPRHIREYRREEAVASLVKLVKTGLEEGPVWVFAHRGKRHEVMHILSSLGVPFYVTPADREVALVYEKYGVRQGELRVVKDLRSCELLKEPCVVFSHAKREVKGPFLKIRVSGWASFESPLKKVGEHEYVVSLSNHADYWELMRYVSESNPELVITDACRARIAAQSLARAIVNELGIAAIAMPVGTLPKATIRLW